MLGAHYRIQIENNTGVALTVTIKAKRFKFASDGALVFEGSESTLDAGLSVASASVTNGTTQDNTTVLFLGGDFYIEVTAASTPTGPVTVRLQRSTDGGTTWPTDRNGEFMAGFNLTATGTYKRVARVE